nr:Chain C, ZINC FINGER PROTEIN ZFPM1 [Homo sapiens]2XU7_D Chain D, ZINC FINGER PROTEIN ZFPM1 [Homo sapiens]
MSRRKQSNPRQIKRS